MLKVGIIGCGKIADAHLAQIRRIGGCEVIGTCDREILMARQLAERFGVPQCYNNVDELLAKCRPDVVHITTPPQSHFALGKQCLENNCHVYMEKPFTLNTEEAEALVAIAEKSGRKMTIGHDLQFSHGARRLRQAVREGYLGGPPVHLESYYCYDLSDPSYARALLADKQHWVRKLPGKLLHNIINHGVARLAEYIRAESPEITARGFTSATLRSLGETEIIDELRVIIAEPQGTTAYFTFSSQMRPNLNAFRVYGPRNGLELDEERQTLIKHDGNRLPSYAEKFIPPVKLAKQHLANVVTNGRRFLASDFHMKSGMKHLIQSFYQSIVSDMAPPIPYREILLTSRIMDAIFQQIGAGKPNGAAAVQSTLANVK